MDIEVWHDALSASPMNKSQRHLCSACGRRIIAFRPGGRTRAFKPDSNHDLCFRCWIALHNRTRHLREEPS
jgi:hypothetical protein